MSEERWPAAYTPTGFLQRHLKRLKTNLGRTFAEAIAEFQDRLSLEYDTFSMAGRTQEDRAQYNMHVERLNEAIEGLLRTARKDVMCELERGAVVARGSYSPHEEDETIPARYWPFLHLNFDTGVASGEKLTFRNVRLAWLRDFSEEQRKIVNDDIRLSASNLRQIEADEHRAKEMPAGSGTSPLHDTDIEPDRPPPIYTRVFDAWKVLPEKAKAKISNRGGKKKIAELIHSDMQDVPFASVEREFRRVLSDLEESGRKPET